MSYPLNKLWLKAPLPMAYPLIKAQQRMGGWRFSCSRESN